MVDYSDLIARLRSNEALPVCPYDMRSPDYWTAPDDKPCVICGGLNDPDAPDLCRGADTRLFRQAATALEALSARERVLREALGKYDAVVANCPANKMHLGERLCPNCNAGPDEGCRREVLAGVAFVEATRTALTNQDGGEKL